MSLPLEIQRELLKEISLSKIAKKERLAIYRRFFPGLKPIPQITIFNTASLYWYQIDYPQLGVKK